MVAGASASTAASRLRLLADLATSDLDAPYGGFHTEAAIRAWSRADEAASVVQARVDTRRLSYITSCFAAAGHADAPVRAQLLLAAVVGAQHLARTDPSSQRTQLQLLVSLLLG